MVRTAGIFRALADEEISPDEATARLGEIGLDAPFSNGFYHHREGYRWIGRPEGHGAQSAHP
jgi:hypothetical protein